VPNARSLRLGDKGTVFVSNRVLDKVYAIVDRSGKREARVIASGLDRPNGLAIVSEQHGATAFSRIRFDRVAVDPLERASAQLQHHGAVLADANNRRKAGSKPRPATSLDVAIRSTCMIPLGFPVKERVGGGP